MCYIHLKRFQCHKDRWVGWCNCYLLWRPGACRVSASSLHVTPVYWLWSQWCRSWVSAAVHADLWRGAARVRACHFFCAWRRSRTSTLLTINARRRYATFESVNIFRLQNVIECCVVTSAHLDAHCSGSHSVRPLMALSTGCFFFIWHFKICITSFLMQYILWNFHRQFYTFGILFVAIGNTELSSKMASCTFYSSGGSCVAVDRQYLREFSVRFAPLRDSICRIIKQFRETGSVWSTCEGM
jgi:hypothetical protein